MNVERLANALQNRQRNIDEAKTWIKRARDWHAKKEAQNRDRCLAMARECLGNCDFWRRSEKHWG